MMIDSSYTTSPHTASTTALLAFDTDGRLTHYNEHSLHLLAGPDRSSNRSEAAALLYENPAFKEALDKSGKDGKERPLHLTISRLDGIEQALSLTISPCSALSPASSTIVWLQGHDESQILDLQKSQLEYLALLGGMAAGFSHELGNPLAGLAALTEVLLAETEQDDPRYEYGVRMSKQIQRIDNLIRLYRKFEPTQPPRMRPRRPVTLVRRALAGLADKRTQRPKPKLLIHDDLPQVMVCGPQISECLQLLFENADEAAGDTPPIEIEIGPSLLPQFIRFSVRNQGQGIQPKDLARVFDPFYTTKAKGQGIGLTTARMLAVKNGGSLEATSNDEGTEFILLLRAVESSGVGR